MIESAKGTYNATVDYYTIPIKIPIVVTSFKSIS